jgi:hypothetical protein
MYGSSRKNKESDEEEMNQNMKSNFVKIEKINNYRLCEIIEKSYQSTRIN